MSGINVAFQDNFLGEFFASAFGPDFCLTGGTALARFYLKHRESLDLDLFTHNQKLDFSSLNSWVISLAKKMALEIFQQVTTDTFLQYIFKEDGGETLKVDFVKDVPVQFGEVQAFGKVRVDALENIAVNKVLAVFGRTEAKDFIDLYFLLNDKGFLMADLIAKAKKKDLGLSEFYLANSLGQAEKLQQLPTMLTPFDLEKMKMFYQDMAIKLLEDIKPEK